MGARAEGKWPWLQRSGEEQPGRLQIQDRRDSLKEHRMFASGSLQMRIHEVCVAQRTPENLDPLFGRRDLRSHVAAVHHTCKMRSNSSQAAGRWPPLFHTRVFSPWTRMLAWIHNSRSINGAKGGGGDVKHHPNMRTPFRLAAAAPGLPAMPDASPRKKEVALMRHLVLHHLRLGECPCTTIPAKIITDLTRCRPIVLELI